MKKHLTTAIVASVICVGTATAYALGLYLRTAQAPGPMEEVTGPQVWVPFSATYKHVNENGEVRVGRFYRASDGSTRSESGLEAGVMNIIGIKNISEGLFYLWKPTTGWESRPMDVPSTGWKPRISKTVAPTNLVTDRVDGFALIKSPMDRRGATTYEAPELNFMPLRVATRCQVIGLDECGVWLTEIIVGEQLPEYFKPPIGTSVARRSEPGGIVRQGPRR
jgi:hypothetical protein